MERANLLDKKQPSTVVLFMYFLFICSSPFPPHSYVSTKERQYPHEWVLCCSHDSLPFLLPSSLQRPMTDAWKQCEKAQQSAPSSGTAQCPPPCCFGPWEPHFYQWQQVCRPHLIHALPSTTPVWGFYGQEGLISITDNKQDTTQLHFAVSQ